MKWFGTTFLLFFCGIFFANASTALIQNTRLKGLAVVHIRSKRAGDLILQQAVFVAPDRAQFVGLDDFGGIPFVVTFEKSRLEVAMPDGEIQTEGRKLKKLLSLPLKQNEFLSIIRYEKPLSFESSHQTDGTEFWKDAKRKKLSVVFSDFMQGPVQPYYPRRIVVEYKKSLFDLKWQNLEFQNSVAH